MTTLVRAATAADIPIVRQLFGEYARSLDFQLCFQSFDDELATLPGKYAPPTGRLLLLETAGAAAGCIALRGLDETICEMKRLWVRPQLRSQHLGRRLAEQLIVEAREIGYERMRLDTIGATMTAAVSLYRSLGFVEIPPYYENPIAGALFLELDLRASSTHVASRARTPRSRR